MMIDSHCHLADDVFSKDLDEVVARARAAGVESAMVILAAGDAAEEAQAARVGATVGRGPGRDRRAPARRSRVRRRPGAGGGGRARAVCPDAVGAGGRRDRPRLPLRFLAARRCSSRSSARRCGWRASCDYPVVIHTREADDDTLAILARGRRRRAARRAALLHRNGRAGSRRPRSRLLHFGRRNRDLPEGARAAGDRQDWCRSIGC